MGCGASSANAVNSAPATGKDMRSSKLATDGAASSAPSIVAAPSRSEPAAPTDDELAVRGDYAPPDTTFPGTGVEADATRLNETAAAGAGAAAAGTSDGAAAGESSDPPVPPDVAGAERRASDAGPPGAAPAASGPATPSGPIARPSHHVSRAAVSLAFLHDFAARHRLAERKITTSQLVQEIIKPATAAKACRYTDLLLAGQGADSDGNGGDVGADGDGAVGGTGNGAEGGSADAVNSGSSAGSKRGAVGNLVSLGRPFYFVSHAWSRVFTDTLAMVTHHFEPEQQRGWRPRGPNQEPQEPWPPEDVFVWFDMFAINQHQALAEDDSDLAALWEAVQDADQTLMVLDPEGTLLTRIWCLYEAWQSGRAGVGKLRLLSYNLDQTDLRKVFIGLDVNRAQATVAADRDRILEDIRRDVGSLDAMTQTLKDALVSGAASQAPPADAPWTEEGAIRMLKAAELGTLYGRHAAVEPLLRRAYEGAVAVLGPDHTHTAVCANNLAGNMYSQGRLAEAESLFREVLQVCERTLEPQHELTLKVLQGLASVLGAKDEAELLLRKALEGRKSKLGPEHPDTMSTLNNLAVLLYNKGELVAAEPLMRQALEVREKALGPDHPSTLKSLSNLASLLDKRQRAGAAPDIAAEAEALFRRAMHTSSRVLGPQNPSTLIMIENLALMLEDREVSRKEKGKGVEDDNDSGGGGCGGSGAHGDNGYGKGSVTTVGGADGGGDGGRLAEAEVLFRRVLEGRMQVLGPNNWFTKAAVTSVARVLRRLGREDEAVAVEMRYRGDVSENS